MVTIHSGMAAERTGLVSNQAKPVEVYSQMSCPVARRKWVTASSLSRCLGLGPTGHGFLRLLGFWVMAVHLSMYVDIILFDLLRGDGTSG
ncbi:hypothetical protein TNCV_1996901 [Trichonephila clavipes]|uniref:Uncharacterized protein n=1 Tax=Trichonephila clavipes TaxID=2585209 RepID=A0A8X6V2M5_TRICX|nr:hypothetical protein TNCV_1996901 [Trichonephila clavipes]